jgi:hypothetical protein
MCDMPSAPDGRIGQRIALRNGTLVVVPPRPNARPRVLGAVLETTETRPRRIAPILQFWIEQR